MFNFIKNWFSPKIHDSDHNFDIDIDTIDYPHNTTPADLYYVYRLLLGRKPERDGWNGWLTQIGKTTPAFLAECFMSLPEFKAGPLYTQIIGGNQQTKPVAVELDGYKQYVRPNDNAVGSVIYNVKTYEPEVKAAIQDVLKPSMTFLDIGANIGFFSLLAAQTVGATGRVLAFEPNQQNYMLLSLSAAANHFDQIEIFPLAVADKAASLIYSTLIGSNGVITEEIGDQIDNELFERLQYQTLVRSVQLDKFLYDIDRLDVIKIDIEGGEYSALSGAIGLLKQHQPIIFTEFAPVGLQGVSGITGEDYLQFLIDLGYRIDVISPNGDLQNCQQDIQLVMQYFEKRGNDHIDLRATPITKSDND